MEVDLIEIVIVDDHAMVREGLRLIVERESDIHIAGETGSGNEAMDFLRRHTVDEVVLDIVLPDRNGIEVLKDIRHEFKDISVLILSIHSEDRFGVRAIQAGAAGYLSKGSAAEELVKAIRVIHRGENIFLKDWQRHLPRKYTMKEVWTNMSDCRIGNSR